MKPKDDFIPCFACGAKSLHIEGECHPYMLSSPGCWAMFCEVSEKEYSDLRYSGAHQYTVDAYACQHIGMKEDKRAVNSVHIHLASLYAIFVKGMSLVDTSHFRNQFSQFYKGTDQLRWLDPPPSFGTITIYDLWDNDNPVHHHELAESWAESVWNSWSDHHERISLLVSQIRNQY